MLNSPPSESRTAGPTGWRVVALLSLALLACATVPGCGGCFQDDPLARKKKEDEEKKKEKPKDDFVVSRLSVQPQDASLNQNLVKPGHWVTATQQAKANNFDFQAELESAATTSGGQPIVLPDTGFQVETSRPASLPKGQAKQLETIYFVPRLAPRAEDEDGLGGSTAGRRVFLQTRLRAKSGSREVARASEPTTAMPDFQYFLVVLAADAGRYAYVKRMDSVVPPVEHDGDDLVNRVTHYRVVVPSGENRVLVPSHPLAWTSIAYVLWDGLNPNLLTPDQQQALVDWLHAGGQIIVSGPGSLETLRGSFLDPYLPARGGAGISLSADALAALDAGWSLTNRRTGERAELKIAADKPLVGIELQKHPEAEYLQATGQLVLERRVGAGRIVVTAFSLKEPQLTNWRSFDSFFNACLLRRPRRTFGLTPQTQSAYVLWTDHPQPARQLDARFVTGLRYFTRDVGSPELSGDSSAADASQLDVAGWHDASGAAHAARQSLRDAAGISVPKAGFVLQVLAVYLLVLAPLNWGFFRAIGRLEWAWVAAPVIALVGAFAVVRLAQLDIGFARSRTEIGVLELQGGYRRGHLTRYTALYTSLSTAYDLSFENSSALALPFPSELRDRPGARKTVNVVQFRRDRQVRLTGFQVGSNSTGLVHSEELHDLGGSIDVLGDEAQGWRLRNTAAVRLQAVGVLRRNAQGGIDLAWIGALEPGQSRPLTFSPAASQAAYFTEWRDSPTTCSYERQQQDVFRQWDQNADRQLSREELAASPEWLEHFADVDSDRDGQLSTGEVLAWCVQSRGGELTLGRLLELACQRWNLEVGEMRMVGWTAQDVPGLTIRPRASQETLRTMVLVHLRRGALPPARPDVNLKAEFVAVPAAEPIEDLSPDDSGR